MHNVAKAVGDLCCVRNKQCFISCLKTIMWEIVTRVHQSALDTYTRMVLLMLTSKRGIIIARFFRSSSVMAKTFNPINNVNCFFSSFLFLFLFLFPFFFFASCTFRRPQIRSTGRPPRRCTSAESFPSRSRSRGQGHAVQPRHTVCLPRRRHHGHHGTPWLRSRASRQRSAVDCG
jgi:hypothetical protein